MSISVLRTTKPLVVSKVAPSFQRSRTSGNEMLAAGGQDAGYKGVVLFSEL